jgi:threonine dehydrogenase-like Zn-dependent dehydrogenase
MRHTQIIVTHYGGLDTFQLLEEERPEPEGGEVRVRVLAAGVSLPDLMMCEGVHPETPRVPVTPGWDLVGVVASDRRWRLSNQTRADSGRAADHRCARGGVSRWDSMPAKAEALTLARQPVTLLCSRELR